MTPEYREWKEKREKQNRQRAAFDFCVKFPVRYRVWCIMDQGFQGTFDQLVGRVGSKRDLVLHHLMILWDAEIVTRLPPGTPTGAIDSTASDGLMIEGSCIDLTNSEAVNVQ